MGRFFKFSDRIYIANENMAKVKNIVNDTRVLIYMYEFKLFNLHYKITKFWSEIYIDGL